MSMGSGAQQGQSVGTGMIVLGVAIVAVGAFTGAYALIPMGIMMIAGGAMGIAMQPKASTQQNAKARQVEISTAAEGFPIPVIFGTQKVIPNYMQYNKRGFRAVPILQTVSDKKDIGLPDAAGLLGNMVSGGVDVGFQNEFGVHHTHKRRIVGYNYYLTYELGLCMGPVDGVTQVWSSPGEREMRRNPVELNWADGEHYLEFDMQIHIAAGLVRLYRGNPDQVRTNPGGSDPYCEDYVSQVEVLTRGSGYGPNTRATYVGDGTGVELKVILEGGEIDHISIPKRGHGCTGGTVVLSNTGGGSGATFKVEVPNAPMNYRNICWALMGAGEGYYIGNTPIPRTYQFIIRRFPRCVRDDGSTVEEMKTRGSADLIRPTYYSANPAAMIYEILTNRVWGRGLSSAIIDEASFIAASVYFEDRHIGMDFTLDQVSKLSDLLDLLRSHLRTILVWNGDTVKMRVLMNPAETCAAIQTLNEDNLSDLNVTRPDWNSTYNEVRAEYIAAHRNYRPEPIHVTNPANMSINGGRMNPINISMPAFTDFNTAWKQVHRIASEFAYPLATATFKMNMFRSQLEVGDTFRVVWSKYGSGKQTTYFTCLKKTEASGGEDMISITAIEEPMLAGVDDEELSVAIPDKQGWELLPDLSVNRVGLFVVPGVLSGDVFPIMAFEMPAIATGGSRGTVFLGEKGQDGMVGFDIFFQVNTPQYQYLDNYESFAITGVLATPITDVAGFDRTPEGAFDFALTNPDKNESTILGSANIVQLDTDDLETLLDSGRCYMFVDDEIMQIGYVVKIDENRFRAFNVLRGVLGTDISPHDALTTFAYVDQIPKLIRDSRLVDYQPTDFYVNPVGTESTTETGDPFRIFFTGRGNKPLAPIPISIGPSSKPLTHPGFEIKMRPRDWHRGADTKPFFEAMANPRAGLDNLEFALVQLDEDGEFVIDDGDVLEPISWQIPRILSPPIWRTALEVEYKSDLINDLLAGIITFRGIIPNANTRELRFYAMLAGKRSVDYAAFYIDP